MIALLIALFTTNCFATTISSNSMIDQITPNYVGTLNHITTFNIKNDGTAKMRGALTPKNETVIDNVKITFVIEDISGNVKYNKTYTAIWSDLFGQYIAEKSYTLSSKGIYTFHATYACYKNGTLVERIRSTGIAKAYK